MSAKRKRKNRNAGTVCISLIVLAFLGVMSIQIYKLKQKDQNYQAKEEALQQQYEQETERLTEIEEYDDYTKTTQFIEDIAKSKLGLAYDNEIIFKESEEQ